jgi:excisionase family DNA binding protein
MSRTKLRTAEQEQAAFRHLTTAEVADRLNVSRTQVVALIRAKKLRAIDVGVGSRPEYRIAPADLDAFLALPAVA